LWHCTGVAHQRAAGQHWLKGIREDSPLKGTLSDFTSHCEIISWIGQEGETFANEYRLLDVSRDSHFGVEGWELDFVSFLESVDDKPIYLDGDLHQTGFQFRASLEVADTTSDQTYFLSPEGRGQPGTKRSSEHADPAAPVNSARADPLWNAMSFVLNGKRYTVLYIDHPRNPRPARYVERRYGRLGRTFTAEVSPKNPFQVHCRLWVQEGELTIDQCNELQRIYLPDLAKEIDDDPFGSF
jgi:hypothetical protein